ncbi:hypothetical protein D3C76_1052830 [compost metagenome]
MARGERKGIANLQLDPFVSEFRNTNFRALQIAQQSHVPTVFGSDLTNQASASNVLTWSAMRKIQTRYI